MSVLLTNRIFAFFSRPGTEHDEEMAQAALFAETQGFTRLNAEGFLCSLESCGEIAPNQDHYLLLDLFKGTLSSNRSFKSLNAGGFDWQAAHAFLEKEAQFYNLCEMGRNSFRLESDRLGIKPLYLVETDAGHWLASSIRDLLAIFPDYSRKMDPITLYGLFAGSQILSDRTLFEMIRRIPTGAAIEWDSQTGFRIRLTRKIRFPKVRPGISTQNAMDEIVNLTASVLKRRTENAVHPLMLALSGGFDSRLIGRLVREQGIQIKAYTYGEPFYHETQIAMKIAKKLGVEHKILPYPVNNMIEKVQLGLDILEGQGSHACLAIANLFSSGQPAGAGLLHGFLAGYLSGANLKSLPNSAFENFEKLTEGIMSAYFKQTVDENCLEGVRLCRPDFVRELDKTLSKELEPYQALLLWDLENRQRRVIGCHIQLLGSQYDIIAPSYDVDVIRAWFRLPLTALENQSLLRKIFESRYPELAKIPHASEAHPILPNLATQVPLFFDRFLKHHLPKKILGESLYRRWRRPDIEFLWSGLTEYQRAYLLSEINSHQGLFEKVFAVRPSEKYSESHPLSNFTIQNTFMLARWARTLEHDLSPLAKRPLMEACR